MALPISWQGRLAAPVVAAPMFLISTPELVIECCRNGVIGTFPALNARTSESYADWLDEIGSALTELGTSAPFGVNLVAHASNARLSDDLTATVDRKVPLVITSLGVDPEIVTAVQSYGGAVFHDVTTRRFAERALEAGVDGLIAVSQGGGGHAGRIHPFPLLSELRQFYDGPLVLGGAISNGAQVAAAQIAGADMAYMGTRFLATRESNALPGHIELILKGNAESIVLSPGVSGVPANFLRESLIAAGIDPESSCPPRERNFGTTGNLKPWRDIWAAGQGISTISDVPAAANLCREIARDYHAALAAAPALASQYSLRWENR